MPNWVSALPISFLSSIEVKIACFCYRLGRVGTGRLVLMRIYIEVYSFFSLSFIQPANQAQISSMDRNTLIAMWYVLNEEHCKDKTWIKFTFYCSVVIKLPLRGRRVGPSVGLELWSGLVWRCRVLSRAYIVFFFFASPVRVPSDSLCSLLKSFMLHHFSLSKVRW